MLTKKHHKAIAEIVRQNVVDPADKIRVVNAFVKYLVGQNSNFNEKKFKDAAFGLIKDWSHRREVKNVYSGRQG